MVYKTAVCLLLPLLASCGVFNDPVVVTYATDPIPIPVELLGEIQTYCCSDPYCGDLEGGHINQFLNAVQLDNELKHDRVER